MDKVNKLMKKVDRLHELIYKEPVNNNDKVDLGDIDCLEYIEGLSNGLEIAIALLEDRDIEFR